TCLMTSEVPEFLGATRLSGHGISPVADNLILMRYLEIDGRLERALSVLKARGIAHDTAVRRLVIDPRGARVAGGFEGLRVVLPEGRAGESVCEVLARLLRDLSEPATLHSDLPSPEVAAQLPYRFHLVLPIVGRDLIGLLYVGKAAGAYSEEHLRLLAVVAS